MTETKPKRRWFTFSIRDLLWLTLVVALAIGWWINFRDYRAAVDREAGIHDELTALREHVGRLTMEEFERRSQQNLELEYLRQNGVLLRGPIDNMPIMPPPAKQNSQ